jgi:hypothetical protein
MIRLTDWARVEIIQPNGSGRAKAAEMPKLHDIDDLRLYRYAWLVDGDEAILAKRRLITIPVAWWRFCWVCDQNGGELAGSSVRVSSSCTASYSLVRCDWRLYFDIETLLGQNRKLHETAVESPSSHYQQNRLRHSLLQCRDAVVATLLHASFLAGATRD